MADRTRRETKAMPGPRANKAGPVTGPIAPENGAPMIDPPADDAPAMQDAPQETKDAPARGGFGFGSAPAKPQEG
jgi:hypothetical protein